MKDHESSVPSLAPISAGRGSVPASYVHLGVEPPAPEGMSAASLLQMQLGILRKRFWYLLALGATGFGIGFALYLPQAPQYMAATTIELQPVAETFLGTTDPLAGSFSAANLNAQTQISILRSGSLMTAALERMERESAITAPPPPGRFSSLRRRFGFVPLEPAEASREAIHTAASTMNPRIIPGTRIILISASSTIPEVAANLVNAVAAEYVYQNQQYRSSAVQRTSQWLVGQLEETKFKLEQAEQKLQEFVRKSGNVFVMSEDTLANSRLRQLHAELTTAQTDRINKENRYTFAKGKSAETLPPDISVSVVQQLSSLDGLRRQMADLTTTLMPGHYKVQRLQAQIDAAEQALARERDNIMERLKNDYEAALRRERTLSAEYARQASTVTGQADVAAEYGTLKREVDILRQSFNGLLQQQTQFSLASAIPVSSVRVIDAARPNATQISPSLFKELVRGGALGLLLGYGCAFLHEHLYRRRLERRFASPGNAGRLLNVPELGVIPTKNLGFSAQRPFFRIRRRKGTLSLTSAAPETPREPLHIWGDKTSIVAESFRLTLTSLTRTAPGNAAPRVVLVTSPSPGEGKTTVAANLGVAMAEVNRKTLVIDMDLRRPSVHSVFGLTPEKDWTSIVLGDEAITGEAVERFLHGTRFEGLSVLAARAASASAIHAIFNSPRLDALLAVLRQRFSMVLLDSPPVLQFPEARLAGRLSDGAVMVIRSRQTERDAALVALRRLAEDAIPLLGTILNDWDPKVGGGLSHHYGNDYYSRYYEYQTAAESTGREAD
ncbi:MAG: polysaccharide biosynthesis tyrosine autokinase [Bryobacteraceae bacterium]|nr:polysaccharide biosynthesis tyrosine autokinase [Bryobacteraceae bacterium]